MQFGNGLETLRAKTEQVLTELEKVADQLTGEMDKVFMSGTAMAPTVRVETAKAFVAKCRSVAARLKSFATTFENAADKLDDRGSTYAEQHSLVWTTRLAAQ